MLDCLQLLHFHIGSQITNIRAVKDALRESSRIFVELYRLGANMRYLDCGGGLGVDYDGSQTNFHSSVNYTLQEYAADIVSQVAEACNTHGVPHPDLVTESGRALVAHHSVLVYNVLATNEILGGQAPAAPGKERPPGPARSCGRPTAACRGRTSRRPTTTSSRSRRRRSRPSTWGCST